MRGTKPHLVVDNKSMRKAPAPPSWLSGEAKKEWRRTIPAIVERRILTVADLASFENYCVAVGTVRQMEATIQADGYTYVAETGIKRHPAVAIQAEAMTRARLLAAELGLTPVSRSRPAVREDADDGDDLSPLDI